MEIPLFPLHVVLAPGMVLPLHIFEERYRRMVRHCLDTGSPFGVVLIRRGREVARADRVRRVAVARVGTLAEIREASRYADGRWDLVCAGTRRFRLLDVDPAREPYLVGAAEPLDDAPGDAAEGRRLVDRVTRRFVDYLALLQPRDGEVAAAPDLRVEVDVVEAADEGEEEAFAGDDAAEADETDDEGDAGPELRIPDDPSSLSFLLTGILQVELERKQDLLEAADAVARLRAIDALLDRERLLLARRLAPWSPDARSRLARPN